MRASGQTPGIQRVPAKPGVQPKHRLIRDALQKDILAGRYAPASRIPTEPELAQAYGVSRITIRKAVGFLEEQGFVSRRPGAGTFVNALRRNGQPRRELKHIAFLRVDSPLPDHGPIWDSMQRAGQWLAERNIALSIAHVTTEEMLAGKVPPLLAAGSVDGILLDGALQSFHRILPEKLGLPYLFIGNRPLARSIPQVRLGTRGVVHAAFKRLHSLHKQPVALLVAPLRIHLQREMLEEYAGVVTQYGQRGPLFQPCMDQDSFAAVETLLSHGFRRFSVITTDTLVRGILHAYAKHGIRPADNPVVAIGAAGNIDMHDRPHIHLAATDDWLAPIVCQTFLDAYRDDRWDVYKEIDVKIAGPPDAKGEAQAPPGETGARRTDDPAPRRARGRRSGERDTPNTERKTS